MMHVVYKEIFDLVGYGFSSESLEDMPISLRRFYFQKHQEKRQAEAGQSPVPQNDGKRVTYDPVKRGQ